MSHLTPIVLKRSPQAQSSQLAYSPSGSGLWTIAPCGRCTSVAAGLTLKHHPAILFVIVAGGSDSSGTHTTGAGSSGLVSSSGKHSAATTPNTHCAHESYPSAGERMSTFGGIGHDPNGTA